MKTAPLIAIEGIDGTGKGTQARLLVEALRARRKRVELFSFPAYEQTVASGLVAAYLNGAMGEPRSIDGRLSAVLYSVDRFERKGAMLKALERGAIVLCDRYVGSNLAHQVARTPARGRPAMRALIERLEFGVFGLPRAKLVIYLDMPVKLAQERVKKKGARTYTTQEMDALEADKAHLAAALREYRNQARGRGWVAIPTVSGGRPRTAEEIHADVMAAVRAAGF